MAAGVVSDTGWGGTMNNLNLDPQLRVEAAEAELARFERRATAGIAVLLVMAVAGYGLLMQHLW